LEHDPFGKLVPTFPDHARMLASTCSLFWLGVEFASREISK
jgi:hypothetical protein